MKKETLRLACLFWLSLSPLSHSSLQEEAETLPSFPQLQVNQADEYYSDFFKQELINQFKQVTDHIEQTENSPGLSNYLYTWCSEGEEDFSYIFAEAEAFLNAFWEDDRFTFILSKIKNNQILTEEETVVHKEFFNELCTELTFYRDQYSDVLDLLLSSQGEPNSLVLGDWKQIAAYKTLTGFIAACLDSREFGFINFPDPFEGPLNQLNQETEALSLLPGSNP